MFDDTYHTLAAPSEGLYKEKGSKFLAFAYPVRTTEEVGRELMVYVSRDGAVLEIALGSATTVSLPERSLRRNPDRLSGILLNATLLRQHIAMLPEGGQPDMPLFDLEQCTDVVRLQGEELEEVLNAEYRECGMEHVTIITRSNKRANMFNQAIRNRILLREEEVNAGDYLMVVKNNYYWLEEDSGMGFIANGDIVEVQSLRNHQELYGFHFADATLRFVDYPDMPLHDCKLALWTTPTCPFTTANCSWRHSTASRPRLPPTSRGNCLRR